MGILGDQISAQLKQRFAERLEGPVQLRLVTRPGSGRLILPGGIGCQTCGEARELAEEVVATAPDKLTLEVVDAGSSLSGGGDVPRLEISKPGEEARIAFQGLPGGYEFATVVDALERVSRAEPGLSPETLEQLERLEELEEPVEIMVFATPT